LLVLVCSATAMNDYIHLEVLLLLLSKEPL